MSTSDQNGGASLTRKQMRELRLTGSTPVIDEETVIAATPVLPRAAEPAAVSPAPAPDTSVDLGATPLTRKQAREQERIRTAAVPVITPFGIQEERVVAQVPVTVAAGAAAIAAPTPAPTREPAPDLLSETSTVTGPAPARSDLTDAGAVLAAVFEAPVADTASQVEDETAEAAPELAPEPVSAQQSQPVEVPAAESRSQVNPDFGRTVTEQASDIPAFSGSFDDIVGDSTGSQSSAPSALIFTQGPTEASLSGPVASTGEVLVTGSYELPAGLGSQGHAHGTTDGKDVDAVLIDGELAPSSSPTPIAASSAVSTSKPAGEVIRPPAPEKGNRLMLTLAIVAGGLALALAAALIAAFTMNVFGN